ncbi:MAG: AEC family transporter [Bacilli bacterium]|nr:AEC family transporter [Bacilli bacterium]
MENFFTVLINVGVMMLYAIPGVLLVLFKLLKSEHAKAIATILLYVCSPLLTIYSFQKISYSVETSLELLIAFVFGLVTMLGMTLLMYLVFKKKNEDVRYRVAAVCCAFGNEAFLGVPIMEALLPSYSAGAAMCAIYLTAMNLIGWTVACFIITKDKKYISIKRIALNPATIAFVIALLMYFFNLKIADIPTAGEPLMNCVTIVAKMSAPLCMIALGMRLGSMNIKKIFLEPLRYLVIAVKQFGFPLIVFLAVFFLPIPTELKMTLVILSAVPVAQIAQTFAELVGQGQEDAVANCLASTITSVISIPLISLLFLCL